MKFTIQPEPGLFRPAMFSYAFATGKSPSGPLLRFFRGCRIAYLPVQASTYFHLPIDEKEDEEINTYQRKYLTWVAEPSGLTPPAHPSSKADAVNADFDRSTIVEDVLSSSDLYVILGIRRNTNLDHSTLRRAYLSRSRACHPE